MTRSKLPEAELLTRAWEALIGHYRPHVGGVLERGQLDDLFRMLTADAGSSESAAALDDAYDLLSSLLGERSLVVIMPVQDEVARPRTTRLTPPGAIAAHAPQHRSVAPPASVKAAAPAEKTPEASRPLFGRYLLAEGYITLSQLTAAILWQRAQRPPVGQIALDWRILTREQIAAILRQKSTAEMFCDHAVRVGWMSGFQRLAVLAKQRRLQKPIGTYFVERGILTQEQVDQLARRVAR